MEQITIAGKQFTAPLRYEEGHELNANEAAALNQTYHENLRNNFAGRVKEAVESGAFDQTEMQKTFNEYAEAYQFGQRIGGGVTRDPVMSEAMRMAKVKVRDKLAKAIRTPGHKYFGKKLSSFEASAISEAAKKLIDRDERIVELARMRVKELQEAASSDLEDLVADIPEASAA